MTFRTINPTTGALLKCYPLHTQVQIDDIVQHAAHAFTLWRGLIVAHKVKLLQKAAALLLHKKTELASLMHTEMGKPLQQAQYEIEKCALGCQYYAEHAPKFLKDKIMETYPVKKFVTFQPLGVILGIMPWNFPFWQVFRFIAPTLMAGNAVILKHAPNVTGCALAIEALLQEADFPKHLYQSLLVENDAIANLIAHPIVRAVTLTGSPQAGRSVAKTAGEHLKKCVLELGGSDPYVVLEDADLHLAAQVCVQSRMQNSGQSCIAAKRFIVVEKHQKAFEKLIVQYMLKAPLGPLARKDLRDNLHKQVTDSISKGAVCVIGGKIEEYQKGFFYPATVLSHVGPGMPAYEEELFGPVACIITARNDSDAIRIANDTAYGLGACVFTQDLQTGEHIAKEQLLAGMCTVNAQVKSEPGLPFGGIKQSGFGRELGEFGILEFVNVKSVCVG